MNWHTDVSIGDLHYLRSKFAVAQGYHAIELPSFIKATEAFYKTRQFRVNGDYFLTWAFLTPANEVEYLLGGMNWIDSIQIGNPWIIEAYMPNKSLSAMRELRHLIPTKALRFKRGEHRIGSIKLP